MRPIPKLNIEHLKNMVKLSGPMPDSFFISFWHMATNLVSKTYDGEASQPQTLPCYSIQTKDWVGGIVIVLFHDNACSHTTLSYPGSHFIIWLETISPPSSPDLMLSYYPTYSCS